MVVKYFILLYLCESWCDRIKILAVSIPDIHLSNKTPHVIIFIRSQVLVRTNFADGRTDRRADGQTDGRTDIFRESFLFSF